MDPPAHLPASSTKAGLPQLTGFLLRRAYAKASDCAQACLAEDTQLREVAILAFLDERGALSQRQLADLTTVSPTVMVKLVDVLEERGWVVRERNADDRRSYALRLTEVGAKALVGLRRDLDSGERIFTRALTPAQQKLLRTHLLALLDDEGWMDIESLTGHAGFLVAQAHRLTRGWAMEGLEPLGLDPRDFGVLAAVGRDQPCSQNHVAHALGVSPPAAQSFVEELEQSGLVRRERHPDDRRFYDLTLTPAGRKRLAAAKQAAASVQARVVERLGPRADEELRALLTSVVVTPPKPADAPAQPV